MNQTPNILISNDDGIHAPGILALIEVAKEFGNVTVVAPDSPQSGMGHAISVGNPLRIYPEELIDGLKGYAVSGTPADCVKLATGVLMDKEPDLILSGINHGANMSVSSIYSGTLSAAREGSIQGIAAIGFSLNNFSHEANMTATQSVVRTVIQQAIEQALPKGRCLNVNIPDLPADKIKGIRVTRMAEGRWIEEFDERIDPFGQKYYWLTGKFALLDKGLDTDVHAVEEGYVSICPISNDVTAHTQLAELNSWDLGINSR